MSKLSFPELCSEITNALTAMDYPEADIVAPFYIEDLANCGLSLPEIQVQFNTSDVLRFASMEPLQYITGMAYFMDMILFVGPGVLIPRPETEELVQLAFEALQEAPTAKILDIGTGSGVIPLSLKRNFPNSTVTTIDVEPSVVPIAELNFRRYHAEVELKVLDFLSVENWENLATYDLIISNPPYVMHHEAKDLDPIVALHEPPEALFPKGDDPLIFYRKIADFAVKNWTRRGPILLEINPLLAKETRVLFKGLGKVEVLLDLQGKKRFIHVKA